MSRLLLLFPLLIGSFLMAQDNDSITLLNGRVYLGSGTKIENDFLKTIVTDEKGESYPIDFELSRVFSTVNNGEEKTFYTQDELQGDYLTLEETRFTTWGSRDARITSKPWGVFVSSLLVSYGSSLFDTYLSQRSIDSLSAQSNVPSELNPGFFGARPTMMQFVVPIAVTLVWALPSFKVKEHQILQNGMKGNHFYYRGYNRIAKQKRMFSALAGGFIGTGLGLISYGILKIN